MLKCTHLPSKQQHVIMTIQGEIVCTDKVGSGYGI